jgi:hypothetical protein
MNISKKLHSVMLSIITRNCKTSPHLDKNTMSQKHRHQKTIGRKLRDLDDHLYFLKESLAKLTAGDEAYIKPLTTELRVLVCMASRTEGLLWRIVDELQINDAVHVHLAGNLDRDHPLALGLQFAFNPICCAGQGNPQLTPEHYSLKKIIKECEALVVSGTGYTHENLIRAVAEQMGSAHEDDGVEPHLIELSKTIISNQPVLNSVLMSDANFVLEVGERALADAVQKINFVRKTRPTIMVSNEQTNFVPGMQSIDFEDAPLQLTQEGTVMFSVNHQHPDWKTNSYGYHFGPLAQGLLSVRATKHPDRTMEICVEGLSESIVATRQAIPDTQQPDVMVGFTWTGTKIVFYLCGEPVDTVEYGVLGTTERKIRLRADIL